MFNIREWYHKNKTWLFSIRPWTVNDVLFTICPMLIFATFLITTLLCYKLIPKTLIKSKYIIDGERGYVLVEDTDYYEMRKYKEGYQSMQYYKKLSEQLKILIDEDKMYKDYNDRQGYQPDTKLEHPQRNPESFNF